MFFYEYYLCINIIFTNFAPHEWLKAVNTLADKVCRPLHSN